MCTTSPSSPRWSRLRSMLMIGRDAAAGADEQHLVRQRFGQREHSLDLAEPHYLSGLYLLHEVGRHHAAVHLLGRHADQSVLRGRVRCQRIRAPVVDAVDDHAEPNVLTRLVTRPFVPRFDQDAGGFRTLRLDAVNLPAQLLRGPERVDHLEVVVRLQRTEQSPHSAQKQSTTPWDVGMRAAFCHAHLTVHTRALNTSNFMKTTGRQHVSYHSH